MAQHSSPSRPARITVPSLLHRKQSGGERITALTAYDYTFAVLLDRANVDVLLVGDSLGNVVQGHETTLPVTLEEIIYHTRCVVRGVARALVVADMPFLSYQPSIERAIESAGRLLKEGGAGAVKLEGGVAMAPVVRALAQIDIPVMGHIGLTPQSYHRMGGYRYQGRSESGGPGVQSRNAVLEDALAIAEAGAFSIVLEGVPAGLAAEVTERLSIPTIGIGAGPDCDGQILVMHDLLGLNSRKAPKFAKQYAALAEETVAAVERYCAEVREGEFPEPEVVRMIARAGEGK